MRQAIAKSGGQILEGEHGIALLTVMLLLLILTVLGVAAITVTSLEIRMAGFSSSTEAAVAAAESCAGTGARIITQTIDSGQLPTSYVVGGAGATDPVVPANAENAITNPPSLTQEITMQALTATGNNDPDVAWGAGAKPDIQFNVGPYSVVGDIDRMYNVWPPGYQIGTANNIFLRIDCQATNIATGTINRVLVVYSCFQGNIEGGGCTPKHY
jgi:Tfp pilus assembly protein PilX